LCGPGNHSRLHPLSTDIASGDQEEYPDPNHHAGQRAAYAREICAQKTHREEQGRSSSNREHEFEHRLTGRILLVWQLGWVR